MEPEYVQERDQGVWGYTFIGDEGASVLPCTHQNQLMITKYLLHIPDVPKYVIIIHKNNNNLKIIFFNLIF